jgi:membrane-associated protease RseP (regulator of RpoE activity)
LVIGNEDKNYTLIAVSHPNNASRGYLGVLNLQSTSQNKRGVAYKILHVIGPLDMVLKQPPLVIFQENFLFWFYLLNLGLGLANLLPLGPVDGGRMYQRLMLRVFGKKRGHKVWYQTALVVLVILLISLFIPILRSIPFAKLFGF